MSGTAPAPLGAVAHYTLLERLDPAGPGELFRARDTHRGRTVVVRLLPRGFTSDPQQLIEQARSVLVLSHPNVITLFDLGLHDGRVFLVFEFVKGQSLRAEMAGRLLNVRRALEIAVQISDAVSDAHANGFVHGGLSPETIVITAKGHAKIPAFALAALGGFDESGGEARLRDYDSPEEARGAGADDRSDVYSIGAILYEMLTARRPMHRGASAPSASTPHVPKELDDVVLRAVAPNPDSRPQTVATLAAELRGLIALVDERGGAGDEDDAAGQTAGGLGRIVGLALLILAVLALVVWWFTRS